MPDPTTTQTQALEQALDLVDRLTIKGARKLQTLWQIPASSVPDRHALAARLVAEAHARELDAPRFDRSAALETTLGRAVVLAHEPLSAARRVFAAGKSAAAQAWIDGEILTPDAARQATGFAHRDADLFVAAFVAWEAASRGPDGVARAADHRVRHALADHGTLIGGHVGGDLSDFTVTDPAGYLVAQAWHEPLASEWRWLVAPLVEPFFDPETPVEGTGLTDLVAAIVARQLVLEAAEAMVRGRATREQAQRFAAEACVDLTVEYTHRLGSGDYASTIVSLVDGALVQRHPTDPDREPIPSPDCSTYGIHRNAAALAEQLEARPT